MNRSYTTDLIDPEWECLKPYISSPNKRGRPRIHSPRVILDAIFYVLRSGCPWRLLLPCCCPPWESVYCFFRRWRLDGTFERLNTALRECLRIQLGRNPYPSAGIVDSQSAKTSGGRRRRARLRRRKESSRPQATVVGGHGRAGAQG